MRLVMLVLGAGAMLAGVLPAEAKDRGDRKERRHHRRDRDKTDEAVGGFVLGALAVGLVAAIAGKKTEPVPVADWEPAPPAETDAEAAVSACAAATEGEGRRTFALAQVGQIGAVEPEGAGYAVRGDVLLRSGWRDAGERRGFRCSVDAQAVHTVTIDGLVMLPPR